MIKIQMHGRLGNQLFQYAYARKIQMETGQKICICFQEVESKGDISDGWEDTLKYFKVSDYKVYKKKLPFIFYKMNFFSIILAVIYYLSYLTKKRDRKETINYQKKWCPILDKFGIRWLINDYYPFRYNNKNILLNGSFESEKYFSDIRKTLLKEIVPKQQLLEKNKTLFHIICESNSVCISIRSFDELAGDKRKSFYQICNKEYFDMAVEYVKKHLENPVFFVFSDNIEWVKQEFDFMDCAVIYENEQNPVWEKLRLMSACKHFIISNSTFSWWAQYLGTEEEKLVIAPCKWRDDKPDLIMDNWILL